MKKTYITPKARELEMSSVSFCAESPQGSYNPNGTMGDNSNKFGGYTKPNAWDDK